MPELFLTPNDPANAPVLVTIVNANRRMDYYAGFTVGGVIYPFDIRQNTYNEDTAVNATIRVIPWAQTYTVIAQVKGISPRTRQYRVVLYTELDYVSLQSQVGQTGILQTPREPNAGLITNAILMDVKRDDLQNPNDLAGELTAQLSFQMLV